MSVCVMSLEMNAKGVQHSDLCPRSWWCYGAGTVPGTPDLPGPVWHTDRGTCMCWKGGNEVTVSKSSCAVGDRHSERCRDNHPGPCQALGFAPQWWKELPSPRPSQALPTGPVLAADSTCLLGLAVSFHLPP